MGSWKGGVDRFRGIVNKGGKTERQAAAAFAVEFREGCKADKSNSCQEGFRPAELCVGLSRQRRDTE